MRYEGPGRPEDPAETDRIEVRKMVALIPVSTGMLADRGPTVAEMLATLDEHQRWFAALPPEEQARVLAEQAVESERRAARREAERCPTCGCHPDEHGDC